MWKPVFDRLEAATPDGTVTFDDAEIFELRSLASGAIDASALAGRLRKLVELYRRWIDVQKALPVEVELQADASAITARCERSAERMKEGISCCKTIQSPIVRSLSLTALCLCQCATLRVRLGGPGLMVVKARSSLVTPKWDRWTILQMLLRSGDHSN